MLLTVTAKEDALRRILDEMGSALVAFSGGADSTFLLCRCVRAMGSRCLAVTACSPTYPHEERQRAAELAAALGARHLVIETHETDSAAFCANPPERCYHCKRELFGRLREIAAREGLAEVCDGSNADDLQDYRPGRRAAREFGVRSPLVEAGLTKADVRALSREAGLPTWDLPAAACLASRIPHGESITAEKLGRIERAEQFLRERGFRQVRVRHHGDMARIELDRAGMDRMAAGELRAAVAARLHEIGFRYVSLDLDGYRTGSMNPPGAAVP